MMDRFEFKIRVYYEDTDAQGVVYYANYLKYLERARSEWLRVHDLPVAKLASQQNIIIVVRRVEIDYLYPARLDDMLSISVDLLSHSKAGFVLAQQISIENKILSNAVLKMACLDATKFKPVRIPDKINRLINKEM